MVELKKSFKEFEKTVEEVKEQIRNEVKNVVGQVLLEERRKFLSIIDKIKYEILSRDHISNGTSIAIVEKNTENLFKEIIVFYSEEDESYIALVAKYPAVSAFGSTEEEAIMEMKRVLKLIGDQ